MCLKVGEVVEAYFGVINDDDTIDLSSVKRTQRYWQLPHGQTGDIKRAVDHQAEFCWSAAHDNASVISDGIIDRR